MISVFMCLWLSVRRFSPCLSSPREAHVTGGESLGAQAEWYSIVEGEHALWGGVSEPYKHTIRAFLAYFNSQMLRHSTLRFRFQNGSVGNFFFAGARVLCALPPPSATCAACQWVYGFAVNLWRRQCSFRINTIKDRINAV